MNELDGLSKGNKTTVAVDNGNNPQQQQKVVHQKRADPLHAAKVAEASKNALTFLKSKKHPGVK